MTDILLHVEDLSTRLGSADRPVRVVDGVDLALRRGETLALLGESGCGKSMTALTLMRLLPPSSRVVAGRVRLDGTDLLRLPESAMRRIRGGRMGMIFQEPQTSLNPVLSVGTQVAEAIRLHDPMPRGRITQRVVELLDAVGIPDPQRRISEYPHQLSGGMKQRVMIAMALAGRPELLIADEPTTALDVTIQAQVLGLIKGLRQDQGMAVLLITHDLGVVAETADRLAVMYAGQIVESAHCAAFFRAPAHPYSRMLMAALPSADKRTGRLAMIPGMVPSLDAPFDGCRFAARCPQAEQRCRERSPGWHEAGPGHRVRCHLWADGGPSREAVGSLAPRTGVGEGSAQNRPAVLDVDELRVHFAIHKGVFRRVAGYVKAVDGVSLTLSEGRTMALVGESGCGKTTVGKGILQLIPPTGGAVRYDDVDLVRLSGRRMRGYRKDLQIVFQDPFASMNPRMLVGDIVAEGLQALKLGGSKSQRDERVRQLLAAVGMPEEAASRYPHEFSGGQRQRVCIARALAVEPRVIVCDEPTSALDVSVQAQILNLLKSLQDDLGLAYLFITHDISVVSYLAHEVAVMYLGRIVERGTVAEILEDPRHPYTRTLLSAVPVVDAAQKRKVIQLEGDMPSPSDPPAGCHFHPRCPQAREQCGRAYPPQTRLSDSRTVHCFEVGAGKA